MNIYEADIDNKLIVRYMGHVTYSNPWTHFARTGDEYYLYIFQSGALYIKEEEQYFTVKKGEMILLDPYVEHVGFKASCCDYYFIHFRFEGLGRLAIDTTELIENIKIHRTMASESSLYDDNVYDIPHTSPIYLPKHYAPTNISALFSLLESANSDFYQKCENYRKITSLKVKEMLIQIARDFASHLLACEGTPATKALNRAIEAKSYIDAHYSQKITSQLLSNIFNVNYNYLNRTFTELTGYTIIDYLNRQRIEHAKALIASSSHLSFTDISYLVGIESPYYFSKMFKKYTGITPTDYAYTVSFKEYQ